MALLLIPGFMLDADLWRDVESELSPFSPFIHGDLTQDSSIETMAARVLEQAPQHFALVGFSMGGYVAREITRRAPERVQGLILIATSARGDSPTLAARKAAASNNATASSFNGLSRPAILRSLHPDHGKDETMIERIRDMNKRLGPEVFVRQSSLVREDGRGWLNEIQCPTLVVAAAQDALRSLEEAQELQAGIPGAKLEVIEDSGHMLPLEVPHALATVMRIFLRPCDQPLNTPSMNGINVRQ